MKLSCLPVSLFGGMMSGEISIGEWAEYAGKAGLDGYDASALFFPNHTATTLNGIKDDLGRRNVAARPVMLCSYPDFTHPDPMERRRQADYLRRDLALASDFGFEFVRVTAGQNHPGLSLKEGAKLAADGFAQTVECARGYGVRMVFENHAKPMAWPLMDFSFKPEAFLAVCELIRDIPVGVNFDTANAVSCGADPVELLRKVAGKVWTVHLNDTSTVGFWTPAGVGKGLVDFDAFFAALKETGFDGWVCIEEAGGNGWRGVDDAVKFARRYVKG